VFLKPCAEIQNYQIWESQSIAHLQFTSMKLLFVAFTYC